MHCLSPNKAVSFSSRLRSGSSPVAGVCSGRSRAAVPRVSASWDQWTKTLPQWHSSTLTIPKPLDPEASKKLASSIKAAALAYKPRTASALPQLRPDTPLHKQLEHVARYQLLAYQGLDESKAKDMWMAGFTTTDIDAGLQVAGVKEKKSSGENAILCLVACETERQMTWSRLEGLVLHWACAAKADVPKWDLPPRGWKTVPDETVDAGGAWQSHFRKTVVADNSALYSMILEVPLDGPLKKGGLIFVLKAGEGVEGQKTKWLKDLETSKDFFLDLKDLPSV